MTLYTVARSDGDNREYNLSGAEAAHRILTDDGREYELRPDGDGWALWSRQEVANIKWHKTGWRSLEPKKEDAEAELFALVVKESSEERRGLIAESQDDYRRSIEEMLADADEDDADFRAGLEDELRKMR